MGRIQILKGKKHTSADDINLFREAVSGVKPLLHDKIPPHKTPPAPRPRQTELSEREVIADMMSDPVDDADLETGEELWFVRSGVQNNVMRKLRRGQYSLESELDLHRMTAEQAKTAISEFLGRCTARGIRCVRVIHGKGLGSHNKLPVLKGKVNHWLRQRNEVLAFCSTRPVDGGTGAIYVLLRRMR